ncbi:MAG TPA: hypothetical protein VKB52_01130, partial [Rhodanobacteraceae bacterium]|nr:hypothetical protein [Rhodanobacteraceae bacterium]
MKKRLALALFVALVPLSATTVPTGAATAGAQHGALHVGLRIAGAGELAAKSASYDASVRRVLIESGSPRFVALASLSPHAVMPDDVAAENDRLFRAASLASDDALVQWLTANHLLATHDGERAAPVIAALTRLESDNAAAWALALALAASRGEPDGVDSALAHMAASARSDEHVVDALHAWLAVYEQHPRPRGAFANPAEADAAPFVDAMSRATAAALPSYQPIVDACKSSSGTARATDCAGAAHVMLYRATSLSSRALGFVLLRNLGDSYITPDDLAARRDLAWIAENAGRATGFSDLDRLAIEAHREDWRSLG